MRIKITCVTLDGATEVVHALFSQETTLAGIKEYIDDARRAIATAYSEQIGGVITINTEEYDATLIDVQKYAMIGFDVVYDA